MINDLTLVIAVDKKHVPQLKHVWPTWMQWKPEFRTLPVIVIYDASNTKPADLTIISDHPNLRFVPWDMPGVTQREKMLTAFVKVPGREVKTTWYMKVDTDVIATEGGKKWFRNKWFSPDGRGRLPVYVSNPWGYSKPANVLDVLDKWGDTVPELARFPRLDIPFDVNARRVCSSRIASWTFFGHTGWTRWVAGFCGDRLPVPSQDTYLYYCAARLGEHTVRIRMKRNGWKLMKIRELRQLK